MSKVLSFGVIGIFVTLASCASPSLVKTQAYAKLKNQRTFENELPVVWRATTKVFENYKLVSREPKGDRDSDAAETNAMNKRTDAMLETDWSYAQSRDKYVEFKVNGSPKKKYLQIRTKTKVVLKKSVGGTDVTVSINEEVEKMMPDGTSDGYTSVDVPDSSRASEVLDKIDNALLAGAP